LFLRDKKYLHCYRLYRVWKPIIPSRSSKS